MFDTELTRKLRTAPALAPLPARQPIGDSFFPSSIVYPASALSIAMNSGATTKKRQRILLDDMGEEIGLVADDDDEEAKEADREPIDIVARLWRF